MKPDAELIAEARQAGFPSLKFAREIDELRRKTWTTYGTEERLEAQTALKHAVHNARSIQRFMWPIRFLAFLFGNLSIVVYISVLWYGYNQFLVFPFGLPEVRWIDVFVGLLVIKFGAKGLDSVKSYQNWMAENQRQESLLWFDRVKENSATAFHNIGKCTAVFIVFFAFSYFV